MSLVYLLPMLEYYGILFYIVCELVWFKRILDISCKHSMVHVIAASFIKFAFADTFIGMFLQSVVMIPTTATVTWTIVFRLVTVRWASSLHNEAPFPSFNDLLVVLEVSILSQSIK